MRAHIFVVTRETFVTCRNRCTCAIGVNGIPGDYSQMVAANLGRPQKPYFKLACDLACTRPGDLVFFYERGRGFHGVYVVEGVPYYDSSVIPDVEGSSGEPITSQWPLRLPIKIEAYFEHPVPEERLFSTREREARFWTWFYRKIQGGRSCSPLNPEAVEGLLELLVKENARAKNPPPSAPYQPENSVVLSPPLQASQAPQPLEDCLRWWLAQKVDCRKCAGLRELFGPPEHLEWFANNVPFHVTGRNIDLLCYHAEPPFQAGGLRYKYTVVELKRGRVTPDHLMQLLGYARWVAGRLADGEDEIVQPVLIGEAIPPAVQKYAEAAAFNDRGVRLAEYEVCGETLDIRVIA